MLHVNATAYGGGVAELLATHVPLLRSIGIDADWQVMHGSDEFFAVTKAVHNGLAGRRHRVDAADAAHLPREGARQRAAARRALRLRGGARPPARGDAQLPARAPRRPDAGHEVDLALPHRPHRRQPEGVGVLPAVRRAARRVGVDDARVRARVARHGARRARATVHRSAVGEEPRAGDAVLPGAHPPVRRRRATGRSCARSAGSTRGRTPSA